jgi:outer membrane lipoprotein SlyB
MNKHILCPFVVLAAAVLAAPGCLSTDLLTHSRRHDRIDWSAVKELRVSASAQSSVRTGRTDAGATLLRGAKAVLIGGVAGLAAGLGGGAMTGISAMGGAVQGGVSGALSGPVQRSDSQQVSHRVQNRLGDWRLIDRFRAHLREALTAQAPHELDIVEQESLWKRLAAAQTRPSAASQPARTDDPTVKEISAILTVVLEGADRPHLSLTLIWLPSQLAMAHRLMPGAYPHASQSGAFEIPEWDRRESVAQTRYYSTATSAHSRDRWVEGQCKLLKREIDRALKKLCKRMARDLFAAGG